MEYLIESSKPSFTKEQAEDTNESIPQPENLSPQDVEDLKEVKDLLDNKMLRLLPKLLKKNP